jgi:hypothetical protein
MRPFLRSWTAAVQLGRWALAVAFGVATMSAAPLAEERLGSPLYEVPLWSVLETVRPESLDPKSRDEFTHLLKLVDREAVDRPDVEKAMARLIDASQELTRLQPGLPEVWTLRAVAALELNEPGAGRDAAAHLAKLDAEQQSKDWSYHRLMRLLDEKGWLDQAAAAQLASARPVVLEHPDHAVALDPRWSDHGAYLHAMMLAIDTRWDGGLLNSRHPLPPGEVAVAFNLDRKGQVSELKVTGDTSPAGLEACQSAVLRSEPFGVWTADMVRDLGVTQHLTFKFVYN